MSNLFDFSDWSDREYPDDPYMEREAAKIKFVEKCADVYLAVHKPPSTLISPYEEHTPFINNLLFSLPDGYSPSLILGNKMSVETADKCDEEIIHSEEFKRVLRAYQTDDYQLETRRHRNSHVEWVNGKANIIRDKGWSSKSYRLRVYFDLEKIRTH